MASQVLIKNSLIIYVVLFFALISFSAEKKINKEIDAISQILNERTLGNNSFYNKVVSPAQSLEIDKSKADRIKTVNQNMIAEFTKVLTTFNSASEDKKVEAVKAALETIEPELNKNSGAHITFFDSVPSAAISRTLLLIPKTKNNITAKDLLNTLTSYKRSAKQNDTVYEYASAEDLTSGQIKTYQGSETAWKGPEAAPAFELKKDIVLKKCRQLLGWRCVTSLYEADSLLKDDHSIQVLFISIYDLENNPDHSDFAKDKRSKNQITGSTAIYFVKESPQWILLYGNDTQWNNGKLSFQGAIQNEFKKDFDRFKERISFDFVLTPDQIQ